MTLVTKLIGWGLMGVLTVGTFWASGRGVGSGKIHNSSVMTAPKECPDHLKDPSGNCPGKTYRSYFLVRTHRGGGFGGGGK